MPVVPQRSPAKMILPGPAKAAGRAKAKKMDMCAPERTNRRGERRRNAHATIRPALRQRERGGGRTPGNGCTRESQVGRALDVDLSPRADNHRMDLNSDLGESFGSWRLGDDTAMLDVVS